MAKKIAVLGGGIAGLTAAWELTSTPELRSRHKVTVYQMGFRLGGKLASGRLGPEAKNVEHGLHVWFGFYENAFALLRRLYDEWERDPRGPFQSWTDVMEPRNYTPLGYRLDGQWGLYPKLWLGNADEPGDGRVNLTLAGVMTEILHALDRVLFHPRTRKRELAPAAVLHKTYEELVAWLEQHGPDEVGERGWLDAARLAFDQCATRIEARAAQLAGEHPRAMSWLLARLAGYVHKKVAQYRHGPVDAYFDWLMADYFITILRGLLNPTYGILAYGDLDRVNHLEFTDFMRDNGASEELLDSTYIRVIYETAFQYVGGDRTRPNVEAGTCLRTIFRMIFTYKGAMLWEVRGGMGDVLIAPLYQTLVARGVEFRFFSKVERLRLAPDKKSIAGIDIGLQARLKRPYEPLITLDYAPCWPDEPRWEYLEEGERLSRERVNFESKWTKEPLVEIQHLTVGRDFDDVVLAMALGAFKPLNAEPGPCAELLAENERFARMADGIGLIPSQAMQLWMDYDLKELAFEHGREGCEEMRPAAVDGPDPFGIWADMTQVLEVEQWRGNRPRSAHYLCGVLHSELYKAPSSSHDVPALAQKLVRENAIGWLEQYAGLFWPGACRPGTWTLDWNVLTDPEGRTGPARLEAQYLRANVEPTECCVGTSVNSSRLRLGANESGFRNLYLAGAWTKTPMNVECVEGAVMSGMLASRAICGLPRVIVGEDWLKAHASPESQAQDPSRSERRGDAPVRFVPSEPTTVLRPSLPPSEPDDDEAIAAQ